VEMEQDLTVLAQLQVAVKEGEEAEDQDMV
jgi:hypothetical protein